MKISWGIKIIFSFVIFAVGIIAMAVISMKSNTDLVNEKYYENEIKYQEHIDLLKSSAAFGENLNVTANDENIVMKLSQPEYFQNSEGEIYFYRSSDAKKDFKVSFQPDSTGIQKIPKSNLDKGLWKVNVTVIKDGKKYFAEKAVFLE